MAVRRDGDFWVDIELMRKTCPPCAEKMERLKVRKVKASVIARDIAAKVVGTFGLEGVSSEPAKEKLD